MVNSEQLSLVMETKEERRARMDVAATKLAVEMDEERTSRLEMLALTKGVVNVGVVLFLKPILKSWQLCLSFKLNVHRHPQLKYTL